MSYHRSVTAVALLLALLAGRAWAADDSEIAREDWKVLGWNDACSVAYELLAYPTLGSGLQTEPVETSIGTLTIAPQREKAALAWELELSGKFSWDLRAAAKARASLKTAGYERPGYAEEVRAEIGARPGLAEVLLTTTTLQARATGVWPGPEWRLAGANFNPLSTCVLLDYRRRSGGPRHRLLLVRAYSPRARLERARAHVENARLLFAQGEIAPAAAEAASGASLAPDMALARYNNAAMLSVTGAADAAVDELAVAVKLDPKYRAAAAADVDFESLRERQDFSDVLRGKFP